MQQQSWQPALLPWLPPAHSPLVVEAIRSFQQGKANAAQQGIAWNYLMYMTGCSDEFNGMTFYPDDKGGRRASDFAEGKRFIGLMIRKLLRPEFTPQPPTPAAPQTIQKRMRARRTKA